MRKNCETCPSCGTVHCLSCGSGPFFGRLLLSLIFILSGIGKIFTFSTVVAMLKTAGFQTGLEVLLTIGIILEILGGLMILLGWFTRTGCILLMIFLLPATFIIHGFWNYEGPEVINQGFHFLKNLAIYGGLLLLLSYGPGRWSIDAHHLKAKK